MTTERERFERCLKALLRHEGGYVDHPRDPGGATNLGITIGTARAYRLDLDHDGDVDKNDVRLLTAESAAPVYRDGYWLACSCDKLPAGVDYMVFDLAVNSGTARAKRYLQECVGAVADGQIGPKTLAAVARIPTDTLIHRLSSRRDAFYRSLGTFPTFGKGWIRRLTEVTETAYAWSE